MAWGSEKQKAFFKAKAEQWELFPPCPDLSQMGDLFDLGAVEARHQARLQKAVRGLKMIKDRRRTRKYEKGLDMRARRKGFKDRHALLASGWTPESGLQEFHRREKRGRTVQPNDPGKRLWNGPKENPFIHNEPMF